MILFIFLVVLGAVGSVAGGLAFEGSLFESLFFSCMSFIVCSTIAIHISIVLSVLLGKRVQWVLRKSDIFPIVYLDEKVFETIDKTYSWQDADDVFYHIDNDEPYLEINRYNIPNWARLLIFELEDDILEYVVNLPEKARKL